MSSLSLLFLILHFSLSSPVGSGIGSHRIGWGAGELSLRTVIPLHVTKSNGNITLYPNWLCTVSDDGLTALIDSLFSSYWYFFLTLVTGLKSSFASSCFTKSFLSVGILQDPVLHQPLFPPHLLWEISSPSLALRSVLPMTSKSPLNSGFIYSTAFYNLSNWKFLKPY